MAFARPLAPGLGFACAIAGAAWLLAQALERVTSSSVVEPLLLALGLGIAIRAVWAPAVAAPGIAFASKTLLESGIVVLGLTLDLGAVADAGLKLVAATLLTVTAAIAGGILLGRLAGLSATQATLVAVGNAICGNSAIAAVARPIGAKKHEVASAIAVSALAGIALVVGLPIAAPALNLSDREYGILAGLTVYAVPQVLAATLPVSVESGQIGALVKLTRVLLLGPTVAIFAYLHRRDATETGGFTISRFVPWFMIGFVLCALARTLDLVPSGGIEAAQKTSKLITIVAMAGLGSLVDLQQIRKTGGRISIVVVALLAGLLALAFAVIHLLGLDG